MGKIRVKINPIVKHHAGQYIKNRIENIEKAKEFVKESNFPGIYAIGHKFIGVGQVYGFKKITEAGQELQEFADKKDINSIIKLCDELSDYLNNVEVV